MNGRRSIGDPARGGAGCTMEDFHDVVDTAQGLAGS